VRERGGRIVRNPLLAALLCCVAVSSAADKKSRETCFLAVPFEKGATAAISLDNRGKTAKDVTIQRYSATGRLLDSMTKTVAARGKAEVNLDPSADQPEFGWFRTVENGAGSVLVSSTYEYLGGNTLTSVPSLAIYRHPLSGDAVQSARRYSIRHKYT
jgi:hypothetical protein